MDVGQTYEVRDLKLAEQGLKNIEWAEKEMGALMKIKDRFAREKPLQGIRVGMALHVTKETAVLVKTLVAGGAAVSITGCNPLSTQDDISAALVKLGVDVFAYKGESKEDYYRFLEKVIAFKPHVTIDDGCDLVSEIHLKHPELIEEIYGGCEETTTGIHRLHAMHQDKALKYPMIAVNDNKTKHLLDNYYGTGQSTFDGVLRASNILIAGKTVVVAGYGSCGKGVSLRAKGLGAEVVVTEVHPFRALQARLDGFRVMPMMEAARIGDIFVTVTGNADIITKDHMEVMRQDAILANSGHFDNEIDMKYLNDPSHATKRNIRPWFDEYTLHEIASRGEGGREEGGAKRVYVAGEGRLVNLACAEGHPSAVMSTSFCGQALAVEYCVKNKGKLPVGVHPLPEEIDDRIASLQIEAMGIQIDTLTDRQKQYMSSWQEGT